MAAGGSLDGSQEILVSRGYAAERGKGQHDPLISSTFQGRFLDYQVTLVKHLLTHRGSDKGKHSAAKSMVKKVIVTLTEPVGGDKNDGT
ncbi:hypothetical protein A6R68_24023 [Neotoma lepida]|uniref:Uncharacterized protein n=1 Tax=Neotoma lepida TaxID=56216 RepID=A0A1A6HUS2_NEOLE|nr:hypothetical protein A6R68_24023 [Neotoma lepida]